MKRFLILLSVLFPTLVFGQAISWRAVDGTYLSSNNFTLGVRADKMNVATGFGVAFQTNTAAATSIQTSNSVTFNDDVTANADVNVLSLHTPFTNATLATDANGFVIEGSPSGSSPSIWSTSWNGTRDGTTIGYNMAGQATASGEGLILRMPAPVSGWVTNMIGMFSNGNNPVAAGTNTGWTLFTNGVATNFHFEQAGNGSLVLCESGTVTTYIVKNSMMALRGTNNSSGYSMQLNASIQIVPADAP